jgi:RNA polymerase sigma factor (sigma-70 family)
MTGDDISLLHEFAANRTETAFSELVQRHLGLVHSAAFRQTGGDAHLAEEIAQKVFILLAQKAGSLGDGTILSAWLYRSAIYVAADTLKQLRRRQLREQEAFMQSQTNEAATADVWQQLAPVLDETMGELGDADRAALVLRYFENKTADEIAAALNIGEEAAQKRVSRALEKLRSLLEKRGVALGATAIAGAVTANAVTAAPVALVSTITAAALAGTTTTAAAILTITKIITMTTIQKIAVTAALAATIGAGIYEAKQARDARNAVSELKAERTPLTNELAELTAENQKLSNAVVEAKQQQKLTQSQFNELLKLRGQAGQSQTAVKELAKAQAALKNQKPGVSSFFTNAMAVGLKSSLVSEKKYALARIERMRQALNLSDAQVQAITDITDKHLEQENEKVMQAFSSGDFKPIVSADNISLQAGNGGSSLASQESEIKAQLTPDQLVEYDAFKKAEAEANKEKAASSAAAGLASELSLTADQQQQIHDLLLQHPSDKTTGLTHDQALALTTARTAGDYTTMINLSMQQELQQLTNRMNLFQAVLTPAQLQQYQQSQQDKIAMMQSALGLFLPQTNSSASTQ